MLSMLVMLRTLPWCLGALVLAACDHTPTGSWTPDERGPRTSTNPRRITYNPGWDTRPAWLPDGSGFFYTLGHTGQDPDQCLGLMPAVGGGLREEVCDHGLGGEDSVATLQSAAASGDGRLAYVWSLSSPFGVVPVRHEIRQATRARPSSGLAVRTLPYTAPSGNVHLAADDLQWLSPSQVLYLGMRVEYRVPCQFCPLDTLQSGLEAVVLDMLGGGITVVPGTDQASSLALGGPDTLYYTLRADARVWRRVLSTGAVSLAHDFGTAGTARDVAVAGTRLMAVLGGRVQQVTTDSTRPPMQVDDGGDLWQVDLTTGVATPVLVPQRWFRRPALSPDGRRLVAEGYALNDTIVIIPGDLWLFDLP